MSGQETRADERNELPWYTMPRGLVGKIAYALMPFAHKDIYHNVIPVLALKPGDDLLDIACGNGHFLRKYAEHVRSVAGLDFSEVGIQAAVRKHARRIAAGTAEFVCQDASKLPWPWEDGRFSAATLMGSLPVFSQPQDVLGEMHRILRPGGRAVLSIEWNAEDGKDHSEHARKWGFQVLTEAEVRDMTKGAGFADTAISYAKAGGMPKIMLVKASR